MSDRFWDGWLTYSFNCTQYRDPSKSSPDATLDWYYPALHRFHNPGLIVNIKPTPIFAAMAHFGYASGAPEKTYRDRGDDVLTMDLKFPRKWASPAKKSKTEFGVAMENLLSLFADNSLDGIMLSIENGSGAHQLPIPSIGFRVSY